MGCDIVAVAGLTARERMELAFFEFIEQKQFSKITVSELIEKAGVSRTTFYRQYVDIFDMYTKTSTRMIEGLVSELFNSFAKEDGIDISRGFEEFCQKLASQKKYILLLCGENGDRAFFEIGLSAVIDFVVKNTELLGEREMFALKFVAVSGIATYIKSILEGTAFPVEYLQLSKKLLDKAQESRGLHHGNG